MKFIITSAEWKSAFSNRNCIAPSTRNQVTAFFRRPATASLKPTSGIYELAGADPVPLSDAAGAKAEHASSIAVQFSAFKKITLNETPTKIWL